MSRSDDPFVHPTAEVDPRAIVGPGTAIWNWTKVREGAHVGPGCRIGQGVYIDHDVVIGEGCKIQNGVSVFAGVVLGDRVFVGPGATFTNDLVPRAASGDEWEIVPTVVGDDASVGANATVVCGIELGQACMVGAGAVVTHDVPPFALVVGVPAEVIDYVDRSGRRLHRGPAGPPPSEDER